MVKAPSLTGELPLILHGSRVGGESGIPGVTVKCADIGEKAGAKAALWTTSDAEARKLGEQTGLDTPVVLAVNDGHFVGGIPIIFPAEAKALSAPPGEYGRKIKTQRN